MTAQSRDPKYIALLALVAGTILLVGNLVRPGRQQSKALQSVPTQAERVRLQRLTQKGTLEDMVAYFAAIAAEIAPRIVRITAAGTSGLVWDAEGLTVTSNGPQQAAQASVLETEGAGGIPADLVAAPPGSPVAAWRASSNRQLVPSPRIPVVLPYVGEWIVAVWRGPDRRHAFAPGLYLGLNRSECGGREIEEMMSNIPLSATMAGGGLFDQDARLLALIVECGERYAAMAVESVAKAVNDGASFQGRLLTRYGMRMTQPSDAERKYFGDQKGLVVREVWQGYPADAAGLNPGDLIIELDGHAAQSPEDLHALVMPVSRETFELTVLRRGSKRSLKLPVRVSAMQAGGSAASAETGVILAAAPRGLRIDAVVPGSPAHQAGIRAGDRVLEVDDRAPATAAQVQAALGSADARFLVLEKGHRRWGVLITP